jgi:hypothetical protein
VHEFRLEMVVKAKVVGARGIQSPAVKVKFGEKSLLVQTACTDLFGRVVA